MFFGMNDGLLCCANFDDSERFCMWCEMMFVYRACAVLCCAVMSWYVVLSFLSEPPPPPPENPSLWTLKVQLAGKPWRPSHCEIVGLTPPLGFAGCSC